MSIVPPTDNTKYFQRKGQGQGVYGYDVREGSDRSRGVAPHSSSSAGDRIDFSASAQNLLREVQTEIRQTLQEHSQYRDFFLGRDTQPQHQAAQEEGVHLLARMHTFLRNPQNAQLAASGSDPGFAEFYEKIKVLGAHIQQEQLKMRQDMQ